MADHPTGCLVHVPYTLDTKAATPDMFAEMSCVFDSALACLDAIEDLTPATFGCVYLLRHAAVLLAELRRRDAQQRTEGARGTNVQPPASGDDAAGPTPPPPNEVFRAPADLVAIAGQGCIQLEGLIDLVQSTISGSRIDDGKVLACAGVLEQAHRINGAICTLLCDDADWIESAEAYRRSMFGRVAADAAEQRGRP